MNNTKDEVSDKFLDFLNSKTGKQLQEKVKQPLNAVMYTRVSSLEQKKGYSLEIQGKGIIEYAEKNNINIIEKFGGTNESAKTDEERKEFERMLTFIRKNKGKIALILVHKIDRFSRSGPNAIYIKEQLKKAGVCIQAITQPIDINTAIGDFQQNMLTLFSHFDNQMRSDRTVEGTREKLKNGEWPSKPKYGYIKKEVRPGEKPVCIIDEGKANHVRFIFESIGYNGLSQTDVRNKLTEMGITMSPQLISEILRSPFYCGYMKHGALKGQIVKGNHKTIISKELYEAVQKKLEKNPHGYPYNSVNNNFPLKTVVTCECGYPLTAYEVPYGDKTYYYYKCQKGCRLTVKTEHLHTLFRERLVSLTIAPVFVPLIKNQMLTTYMQLSEVDVNTKKLLYTRLTEENKKYHTLKMNLGLGKLTPEIFEELKPEFEQKIAQIEEELRKLSYDSSKIETYIDKAIEFSCNVLKTWELSDYDNKRRLHKLIFPKGLVYDAKNGGVLNGDANSVFAQMACLSRAAGEIKNAGIVENEKVSEVLYYPFESSKTLWTDLALTDLALIEETYCLLPNYSTTLSGTGTDYQYYAITATTISFAPGVSMLPPFSGNTQFIQKGGAA